jgi:hypothetical protein
MMTLDGKTSANNSASEQDGTSAPESTPVYEAPVLVPLGNVHALLAGTGLSMTADSGKVGMRS